MDFIKPGLVDWKKRVVTKERMSRVPARRFQQILSNCNYTVELGKQMKFVLVGIAGSDIMEGNQTLSLALIWQLMRAYSLAILVQLNVDGDPIEEKDIIRWSNKKLAEVGRDVTIKGFKDRSLRSAIPILQLIDVMKPGLLDWSHVKMGDFVRTDDCLMNAKYCITMARKIGAPVYALAEDIVQVRPKSLMTVYAGLMYVDKQFSSAS